MIGDDREDQRGRIYMVAKENEEGESFKVVDKRVRVDEEESKTAHQEEDTKARSKEDTSTSKKPITFSGFILSLATSALVFLGEEKDPSSGQKAVNLSQASEMIDLLDILEKKTKGNLTSEEEDLLKNLLFTLRIRFVEVSKKGV